MSVYTSRGPIVLVEGLDLAGKSTLVSFLRDKLKRDYRVRYSRNSLVSPNTFAAFADTERKKIDAVLDVTCPLFLAAHLFDAYRFQTPAPGEIHLQDSSWLRTLAFNLARDNTRFAPLLREVATYQPKFDLAVYLTANIEVRQSRVQKREQAERGENDHSDYLVCTNPKLFVQNDNLLLTTVREYCRDVVVVDTSDLIPEEVCELVWESFVHRKIAQ